MTRSRVTIVVLALLIAAGTVAYWVVTRIDSEAKAVDNGVVEFKKGNYESAVRILSPYADQGNRAAQLNVGIAYAFGKGVPRDRDRARQLLKSALGAKATEMYAWIAKSFEIGDGVEKDAAEATAWYRIATDAPPSPGKISLEFVDISGSHAELRLENGTSRTIGFAATRSLVSGFDFWIICDDAILNSLPSDRGSGDRASLPPGETMRVVFDGEFERHGRCLVRLKLRDGTLVDSNEFQPW